MHEYLLGVAEKIMQASVPADILQKYHELKQSLLRKESMEAIKPTHKTDQQTPTAQQWLSSFSEQLRAFAEKKIELEQITTVQGEAPAHMQEEAATIASSLKILAKPLSEGLKDQQLVEDNEWLMEKLEAVVHENKLLKNMIGKK